MVLTLVAFVLAGLYLALAWPRLGPGPAWRWTFTLVLCLVLAEAVLRVSGAAAPPLAMVAVVLALGHAMRMQAVGPARAPGPGTAVAPGHESSGSAVRPGAPDPHEAVGVAQRLELSVLRSRAAAWQAEGRLDEAWDLLRGVPMETALIEDLVRLADAFDATHQAEKALAVIERLAAYEPPARELARLAPSSRPRALRERLARARQWARGVRSGAQEPPVPPRLGRYQVERVLGRGAMGTVYLAHDPTGQGPAGLQRVAVKTLALADTHDPLARGEVHERFLREAEVASRLRHPHIVRVHESGVDSGPEGEVAWMAMEWLRGEPLSACAVSGGLLPLPLALAVVERVALALAHAHDAGIVHRDVKPANIMVDRHAGDIAQSVRITDFGVARVSDATRTRTGMVLGTPSFMSPEQLAGRPLDGRADLYALGVTLFQLLTGQLPFRGDSIGELMGRIAREAAPDVRSIRPDLPETVSNIVALALEKRADVRYADGRQMAQDLQAVRAALTGAPSPGEMVRP